MRQDTIERLQVKTAEQRFLSVLEREFREAPRVAEAVMAEAQSCLFGARLNSNLRIPPGYEATSVVILAMARAAIKVVYGNSHRHRYDKPEYK
jgi:hypothetical protein